MLDKIRLLAKKKGFTSMTKLEEELGLGNGTITKWNEVRSPNVRTLKKVADFLDVTMDELMDSKESVET